MFRPQLTLVDLSNVREQLRSIGSVLTDQITKPIEKLSFGKIYEQTIRFHRPRLTRFFSHTSASGRPCQADVLAREAGAMLRNDRCR